MNDPTFLAGLSELADLGLVFDAWVYHPQLVALATMAAAVPDLTIVVDHLGGPLGSGPYAGRPTARAEWREALAVVAERPNVVLKIGGIGMPSLGSVWPTKPAPATSEALANEWGADVEFAVELFSSRRCMFESNFPVDAQSVSYPVLWNAFKKISAGWASEDRARLFHGTATEVYRLDAT